MNPGYLMGKPGDTGVRYLNLTSDFAGALYIDPLQIVLNDDFSPIAGITEFPSRFNVTVSVQKGSKPELRILSCTMTPVIAYALQTDTASSMLNETYGGVKNGYIQDWLASPRDISSSSLWITEPNWWWQGQTGFSKQVYVGSATDVHVQFYLRSDVGFASEMWFFSIIDRVSGYALDLRLGSAGIPDSTREGRIKERLISQGYNQGSELGTISTAKANMEQTYTLWTVYLDGGSTLLKIESVDQNTWLPTSTIGTVSRPGGLHVNAVTSFQFQAYWDIYAEGQYWNAHVDRLTVLVNNLPWLTEDFNAVSINALPGWSNPSGQSTYIRTDYNFNVGDNQPILGINPQILAQPSSISAKLEFQNGWYKASRYDVSDSTLKEFMSGYDSRLESGHDADRYYQHYYTLLSIKTTGVYKLLIEAPTGRKHEGLLMYVDGGQVPLANGTATVYLRSALHSVYLRIFRGPVQGNPSPINAFRMRLMRDDNHDGNFETPADDAQSLLVPHTRFSAVYYDVNHAQRYADGDTPSFYKGVATPTLNADTLMWGNSIVIGPTVGLGADALAEYMMRDILTARGDQLTPLYESGGKVLFSYDMVPCTIFTGETDNSILELFLHALTYTSVDGGRPFNTVTMRDATTIQFDGSDGTATGTERVLDLPVSALVNTDGSTNTYNYKDAMDMSSRTVEDGLVINKDGSRPWPVQQYPNGDKWSSEHEYHVAESTGGSSFRWRFTVSTTGTSMDYYNNGWYPVYQNTGYILPPGSMWLDVYITGPPTDWMYKYTFSNMMITSGFYVNNEQSTGSQALDSYSTALCGRMSDDSHERSTVPSWASGMLIVTFKTSDGQYKTLSHIQVPLFIGGSDEYTRKVFITGLSCEMQIDGWKYYKPQYGPPCGWTLVGPANDHVGLVTITDSYSVSVASGIDDDLRPQLATASDGRLQTVSIKASLVSVNEKLLDRWGDPTVLNAKVVYPNGSVMVSGLHLTSDGGDFVSGNLTSLDKWFGSVIFDDQADPPNGPQDPYWLDIDGAEGPYRMATDYVWKYCDNGAMTTDVHKIALKGAWNWAANAPLTLVRAKTHVRPTGIGQLLPVDISAFQPELSFDLNTLAQLQRKYITYASCGDSYTSYGSPITMQADRYGGGVFSYGLSQAISSDHLVKNSSLVLVSMQAIAISNHMNLWGAPVEQKSVISNAQTTIGLTYRDIVRPFVQEGWADDGCDGRRDIHYLNTLADTNGADWYWATRPDQKYSTGVVSHALDSALMIRPTTVEQVGWDPQSTEYEYRMCAQTEQGPGGQVVYYVEKQVPIYDADTMCERAQQIFATNMSMTLDLSGLDFGPDGKLFIEVKLIYGDRVLPRNMTVTQTSTTLQFDLRQFANVIKTRYVSGEHGHASGIDPRDKAEIGELMPVYELEPGVRVFDGTDPKGVTTVPMLQVAVFQMDRALVPAGDIVAQLTNLVTWDYTYLKIAIDMDYWHAYEQKAHPEPGIWYWIGQGLQVIAGAIMIGLGCMMASTGVAIGMFVFGADMITQGLTGRSLIDMTLTYLLFNIKGGIFKVDVAYMLDEGFSFFQFGSMSFWNAIFTMVTFLALGGLMSGFAGIRGLWSGTLQASGLGTVLSRGVGWVLGRELAYTTTALLQVGVEFFQFFAGAACMRAFSLTAASRGVEGVSGLNLIFQGIMIAALLASAYASRQIKSAMMDNEEMYPGGFPIGLESPTEASAVRVVYEDQEFYLVSAERFGGRIIQAVFVKSDSGLVQVTDSFFTDRIAPEAVGHLMTLKNPEALSHMLGAYSEGKWIPSGISMKLRIALATSLLANSISDIMSIACLFTI
jgi:hypothetical protein